MTNNAEWTLRSDLELFGINLPRRFDLEEWAASLRNKPAQNTIRLTVDGALYVRGDIHIGDGTYYRVALCRCGESKNK